VVFLPFVGTAFDHLSKVLSKHNIKRVGLLPRKFSSFLQSIKDDLALKMPGVYSIPCKCRKVYTGQTGCLIETRVQEHHQHICLYHPKKSAVAEQRINLGHHNQVQNASILTKKYRHMDLQGSDRDQTTSQQHKQRGLLLLA
jgi:hypothetical protein